MIHLELELEEIKYIIKTLHYVKSMAEFHEDKEAYDATKELIEVIEHQSGIKRHD